MSGCLGCVRVCVGVNTCVSPHLPLLSAPEIKLNNQFSIGSCYFVANKDQTISSVRRLEDGEVVEEGGVGARSLEDS